jgi:tetratricopeptide (TPR) repeat protein
MRRRRLALALTLVLGVPVASLVALTPSEAEGQKPAAAKPAAKSPDAGEARYDPENVTAISQNMETLLKGIEKYNAKDYTGAIDLFKKAIQMNPRNALGPYLLGEGHLATGNLGEAEAAFKQAEEVTDSRNPVLRAHVLFAVADCYEREKKYDQAKAAWEKYNEHAGRVPEAGAFPASGAARLKAIEDWVKLDKQYEIVRQRIAAEKADGGAGKGDAAAPDAAPKK